MRKSTPKKPALRGGARRARGAPGSDPRLESLYEISKSLATFESVEATLPEVFSIAAGVLPISSAVLVEKADETFHTTLWPTSGVKEETFEKIITHAKKNLDYLIGSSKAQSAALHAESSERSPVRVPEFTSHAGMHGRDSFLVFPLLVKRHLTFGVLQIQADSDLREADVRFMNTVSNLIAVALDRHRRIEMELKALQSDVESRSTQLDQAHGAVSELEDERSLRESFVSSLSHDLRTPLTAARMRAELILRQSGPTESTRLLASRIVDDIERLDRMIRDLLDANRIRAGEKLPLEITHCDLRAAVSGTLEMLATLHGDRLRLVAEPGEIWGYWNCDGIQRVVENLVNNAIKYGSPARPVTCAIQQTKHHVTIFVHNEGRPIPPKDLDSIFHQFKRTASAQRGSVQGWGLGLALARGIAESHGGRIRVKSDADRGTTFLIELPRDARPTQASRKPRSG